MDKTKFTNLINQLSITAQKNKWVLCYNKEIDHLFWTKEPLNKKARLVKVSHETSFYVNPNKKIEGVVVEYFAGNFIEHNPTYKGLIKQFKKKVDKNTFTIAQTRETDKYLFGLGEALRADIYQDSKESGNKLDFDSLVNYALSK